jgi:peptide chain release factor subunit 1
MVSRHDLERLIARGNGTNPVLSIYLDMSVNSENKRTHRIFLAQRRAQFTELDSDRTPHHREALGEALARADRWIDEEFDEKNRGIAIFLEIGGDWMESLQFPVPVQNRLVVNDRPVVAPLAQVIEGYDHHGVVLLDREQVRILSVYLGTILDEIEVHGKPIPTAHDVQAGGYSQPRYQRRKREEMRHFFREFAKEVEEFVSRYKPHDLVVLGTDENVSRFREFLPEKIREMIVYTGGMPISETAPAVLAALEPHLKAAREKESRQLVQELWDRVEQDYFATAGVQTTLAALQEGKVDTLVMARESEVEGVRCSRCGFVFPHDVSHCPFDGSGTEAGVDVFEEMVRLAEGQGATIEFVDPGEAESLRGVGAILRY